MAHGSGGLPAPQSLGFHHPEGRFTHPQGGFTHGFHPPEIHGGAFYPLGFTLPSSARY